MIYKEFIVQFSERVKREDIFVVFNVKIEIELPNFCFFTIYIFLTLFSTLFTEISNTLAISTY